MPKNPYQYINRDLSWLQFNARVLQEAADESVPLLERLRFIGIFSNNLDEFFRVRYAAVQRIVIAGKTGKRALYGKEAQLLLEEITNIVIEQQTKSLQIIRHIQEELEKHGIHIIKEHQVKSSQHEYLKNFFKEKVRPLLMTFMLDEFDKFPHLKDKAAYLAVKLTLNEDTLGFEKGDVSDKIFALIEIPTTINRFVVLPKESDGSQSVIIIDDLIRYCMEEIFNIFEYVDCTAHMIKITRDAELDIDNDFKKSFIEKISKSVHLRRDGNPVRFVYDQNIDGETLQFLMHKLEIDETDSIIPGGRYHNRRDYMNFPTLGHEELTYPKLKPLPVKGLETSGSIFKTIVNKDYLLYTPYQSFSYVINFLREAAIDPKVKSIKITIYRLSNISQVANALINAAKNGKDVMVQIELRARFDEENNIKYAEIMQEEGVKLVFGVPGLKVHSKTCVVERNEKGKIKRYGFISTGNFNESTAKIYTDYTLFTSNAAILKDLNKVFNFFEINYKVNRYKHLIVSPHYSRKVFSKLIDKEIANKLAGREAYIRIKLNSLTDHDMIDKLYGASNAGVKIDLIVRGMSCLVSGVEGMSANIRVISVVDKFLEHPRLFIFCNDGDPKVFISSADWMTRNLDRRVEVGCPIFDKNIKKQLIDTYEICWKDNVKARILDEYKINDYVVNSAPYNRSQVSLYEYYKNLS